MVVTAVASINYGAKEFAGYSILADGLNVGMTAEAWPAVVGIMTVAGAVQLYLMTEDAL